MLCGGVGLGINFSQSKNAHLLNFYPVYLQFYLCANQLPSINNSESCKSLVEGAWPDQIFSVVP